MANLDSERGPHVAENVATPSSENISAMVVEPYAVCIAVDEKHRRLGGLELIGNRGRSGF